MRRLRGGQKVYIIDSKVELTQLFRKVATCVTLNLAELLLEDMVKLAKERQELFNDTAEKLTTPCVNHGDYFKLTGEKLPIICVVVEELILFVDEVPLNSLIKLMVAGRSAGVFVVACTQYLKADIFPRKASQNFHTRVFLGPYDDIQLRLMFQGLAKVDHEDLKLFLGPVGKAVIDENGKLSTRTMPEVMDSELVSFMKGEIK